MLATTAPPFWCFSTQDVAVYGALCGMAALGRGELSARLLRNVAFRELLELVPEVGTGLTARLRAAGTQPAAHVWRSGSCRSWGQRRGIQDSFGQPRLTTAVWAGSCLLACHACLLLRVWV